MWDILLIILGVVSLMAFLCSFFFWKIAQLHRECSILLRCISNMLSDPERAEMFAEDTKNLLEAEGLWK